jgi:threonine dehydratase
MVTLKHIQEANQRLKNIVQYTPLIHSSILSNEFNNNIYLKKENLQITGSFKIRGSFNTLSLLTKEQRDLGVIAASAGNHAQGLAYSAKYFDCKAKIFMPEATPLTKIGGVKSYGAQVILKGKNYDESFKIAKEYALKNNQEFIHPFANDNVIAGQGTMTLEIIEQFPTLEYLIVPVGGGGLITGSAIAAKSINPNIKIIGVVASGANAMKESFDNQKPINSKSVKTIADGIAVRDVDPKMLNYTMQYVDEIIQVNEQEIANAVLFLLEKQKLVVEAAGAVGIAAILHNKIKIENKNIVCMVSGGNIDVNMLSLIIEKGLIKSHRKIKLLITLIDKPGSLMKLTNIIKNTDANIVQIDYDRNSLDLEFGDANVTICLETKGKDHQNKIKENLIQNRYKFKEI